MKRITAVFVLVVFVLSSFSSAATKVATDPSRVGVGARLLGMGKSFVGLADDLNSIFINPSGLSRISNWQVTSMTGKFINEYDYVNLGGVYPTDYGTFGFGFVGGSIGFTAPVGTTEAIDGVRIIPSSTEGVSYSFGNSVMLLSWGKDLKGLRRFYDWEYFDLLSVGASLKFFGLNLSGPGITGGTATGNELDLGLQIQPDPAVRAGIVLQNALPYAGGGKITWANGTDETLPSTLKLGLSLQVIGEKGFNQMGEHELSVNVDRDFFPGRDNIPQLLHMGVEWSPVPMLALRTGIDQETVGTGVAGFLDATDNFTAGVGVFWNEFRFDYAYHQYSHLADNDTHYFSLSYGIPGRPVKEPEIPLQSFSLSPEDKSIVYDKDTTITGQVRNRRINRVAINNSEVALANNRFERQFSLKLGKNSFLISGMDGDRLIDDAKIRILRLSSYKDVPADYWAAVPISILAMEKVISGYPDGTFRPEGNITRAEMCTLLVKSTGLPVVGRELGFNDVSTKHWAAPYIAKAVELGVVKGYPDGTFKPNGNITRAEGVTILARFGKLPESRLMEVPFADVPGRHWAVKFVASAREAGILKYLEGKNFEPNRKLSRAEVAEMLSKTGTVGEKVDNVLDWARGY